jgi:hypothetical protein
VPFDQTLLTQLFADGGPLVFACHEFIPVFLGFFPRDEFPERGDVQDDAIVEVGFEMQVRRPPPLVLEVPQFGEEILLPLHVLGESRGITRYSARIVTLPEQIGCLNAGFDFNPRQQPPCQRHGLGQQPFVSQIAAEHFGDRCADQAGAIRSRED